MRAALTSCGAVDVQLEDGSGYIAPEDVAGYSSTAPKRPASWVSLLPALDPTPMGWKERGFFLGDHEAALFDRTGNIGPTLWLDGRIVGGWAQRSHGEIAVRFLERVKPSARSAIKRRAAKLQSWLGDERVVPRFHTPLERELSE